MIQKHQVRLCLALITWFGCAIVPSQGAAVPPTTTVFFGPATAAANPTVSSHTEPVPALTMRPATSASSNAPEARPNDSMICPRLDVHIRRRMNLDATEDIRMPLLDCQGQPRPEAVQALSLLMRPRWRPRPSASEIAAHLSDDANHDFLANDIRRVHPALLDRLQRIGDTFPNHTVEIVSGYRPSSRSTSRHHHARAVDIRVVGITLENLREFALTLPQTGVGYHPGGVFLHLDVRARQSHWIDRSAPETAPRFLRNHTASSEPNAPPQGAHAISSEETHAHTTSEQTTEPPIDASAIRAMFAPYLNEQTTRVD